MRYLLLLSFIFLLACGDDIDTTQTQKINDLQERIKQDSLLLASVHSEMDAINNVLDSADAIKGDLQIKTMNRIEALDKIKRVSVLLDESSRKIDSLRRIKSPIIDIANLPKDKIVVNKQYYANLQREIEGLNADNVNLKEIIKQKEEELIAKDDVINKIKKEREEQEKKLAEVNTKLAEFETRIAQAEQEIEATKIDAKNQKAVLYYKTGVELKLMFDDIDKIWIEIGVGKSKKELAKQAYQCFKKSYELGYPQAKSQILEMESSKKYAKHL